MSSSIQEAESEHSDYVNMNQGSEEKIESAIKSFKDTVDTFKDVRSKTAKSVHEGAQEVSLGSFQLEDAAKQTATERNAVSTAAYQQAMKERMQQAEQSVQEAQDKLRKITSEHPEDAPQTREMGPNYFVNHGGKSRALTGEVEGPYSTKDSKNLQKVFYNGVCAGDGNEGCIQYSVMLFAQRPDCVSSYLEDSFPILAAMRCSVLPSCSGFSYSLIKGSSSLGRVLMPKPVKSWSEHYEYMADVGIVNFYDQDATCPVPPVAGGANLAGDRAMFVVYYKSSPRSYTPTTGISVLRNIVLGGGGCFSVVSQLGYFSGIQALQASGSLALASTSSGGTWMLALAAIKGGGRGGDKWQETWDSTALRDNQMGNRPIWQIMFKIYSQRTAEGWTEQDQSAATTMMAGWLGCKDETFEKCNSKRRSKEVLRRLLGVSCLRKES